MRYTTVLFDLDHTLLDSDTSELSAFDLTLAEAGIASPRDHLPTYLQINKALWAAVERGEIGPDDVRVARFEQLIAAAGFDADAESMADSFVHGLAYHGELYPGARAMLDQLAGETALALVTNGLSYVQRTRVERLGLADYFDAVIISAEIGCSKPAAAFFDITFERLSQPAKATTLMVGDSLSADIRGAADYGLATCWYNPHGKSSGELHIDHQITELAALPALARGD